VTSQIIADLLSIEEDPNSVTLQMGVAPGDVFEVYVFGLVIEAARREQAIVTYENVNGPFNGVATFRTSPGRIWSQAEPYTHAVIQFSNRPLLEAHLGIYMQGKSGRMHEADVAVLPRTEAAACRAEQAFPKAAKALCAIECKCHDTPLGINLGRSFIGLSAEFGKERAFFVMNQPEGQIGRLLDEHKHKWEHSIVPASTSSISRFVGSIQTVFKSYKVGK
jgi:hypothetical protein